MRRLAVHDYHARMITPASNITKLSLFLLAILAAAPVPAADEWISLHNDENLQGWLPLGLGRWSSRDQNLVGFGGTQRTPSSWLVTEGSWGDFDLEVSYLAADDVESGIVLRMPPPATTAAKERLYKTSGPLDPTLGYEIRVRNDTKAIEPTGSIAGRQRAYAQEYTKESRPYWRPSEWNHFQISARFDHLRVKLNGRVVADFFDRTSLSGAIALRLPPKGEVRFRKLLLRPIPVAPAAEAKRKNTPTFEEGLLASPGAFKRIFDGLSLDGWEPLWGGTWAVEDGAIAGRWTLPEPEKNSGKKPHGWLLSREEFADFVLKLKFRISPEGNSGICIRHPKARREGDPAFEGYEIQVEDTRRAEAWDPSGSVYAVARAFPGLTRSGDWNDLTVYASGPRIAVHLNGKKAADFLDTERTDPRDSNRMSAGPRSAKGFIGIQIHDKEKKIEVKEVEVKPIY